MDDATFADVLVVSPSGETAGETVESLRSAGFRPVVATRCDTGLKLYLDLKPSLVLVEMFLPDGTGFEFIRDLRRFAPDSPVRVFLHTNVLESRDVVEAEARRAGADAVLPKPLQLGELAEYVSLPRPDISLMGRAADTLETREQLAVMAAAEFARREAERSADHQTAPSRDESGSEPAVRASARHSTGRTGRVARQTTGQPVAVGADGVQRPSQKPGRPRRIRQLAGNIDGDVIFSLVSAALRERWKGRIRVELGAKRWCELSVRDGLLVSTVSQGMGRDVLRQALDRGHIDDQTAEWLGAFLRRGGERGAARLLAGAGLRDDVIEGLLVSVAIERALSAFEVRSGRYVCSWELENHPESFEVALPLSRLICAAIDREFPVMKAVQRYADRNQEALWLTDTFDEFPVDSLSDDFSRQAIESLADGTTILDWIQANRQDPGRCFLLLAKLEYCASVEIGETSPPDRFSFAEAVRRAQLVPIDGADEAAPPTDQPMAASLGRRAEDDPRRELFATADGMIGLDGPPLEPQREGAYGLFDEPTKRLPILPEGQDDAASPGPAASFVEAPGRDPSDSHERVVDAAAKGDAAITAAARRRAAAPSAAHESVHPPADTEADVVLVPTELEPEQTLSDSRPEADDPAVTVPGRPTPVATHLGRSSGAFSPVSEDGLAESEEASGGGGAPGGAPGRDQVASGGHPPAFELEAHGEVQWRQRVDAAVDAGNYLAAEKRILARLKRWPDDVDAGVYRVFLRFLQAREESRRRPLLESLRQIARVSEEEQLSAAPHLFVGLIELSQGSFEAARRQLKIALDIEPESPFANASSAMLKAGYLSHPAVRLDLDNLWRTIRRIAKLAPARSGSD